MGTLREASREQNRGTAVIDSLNLHTILTASIRHSIRKSGVSHLSSIPSTTKQSRDVKRERILVIEDEPDIVEIVRYNLTKEGYRVTSSMDGNEGLAIATQSCCAPVGKPLGRIMACCARPLPITGQSLVKKECLAESNLAGR